MLAPSDFAAASTAGIAASITSGPMPSPPITATLNVLIRSTAQPIPARDAVPPRRLQRRTALRARPRGDVTAAVGAVGHDPAFRQPRVAMRAHAREALRRGSLELERDATPRRRGGRG